METNKPLRSEYDLDTDTVIQKYEELREIILSDDVINDYERDVHLQELDTWFDIEMSDLTGGTFRSDKLLKTNGFTNLI